MPFFLPAFKQLGRLNTVGMVVCNVGSRKSGGEDDYGTKAWGLFAPELTIYGFDADADACDTANQDALERKVPWNEIHLPYAIAEQVGQANLYVTQNPMCSSLYEPNERYLRRFPRLPQYASLDFMAEVETTSLDTLYEAGEISEVDFLQIDVQGAELRVFQGADQLLDEVLAIQTEVEFSPLYKDQPLFADVDIHLRKKGFSLFALSPLAYEQRSPLHSPLYEGQLIWGDAIYIRDPFLTEDTAVLKDPAKLFKLACVADALEFTDYALEILEYLTIQFGKDPNYNFADAILMQMSQIPSIVEAGLGNIPITEKLRPYCSSAVAEFIDKEIDKKSAK